MFTNTGSGLYSETGFHIGMDRYFACSWRRHNCRSQVIDLSLSALISWFVNSSTGFLNNSNLHAIISSSLIINLQWVKKFYFAVLEEIYNNVFPHWSAVLISCNHSITCLISFTKINRFKSEIKFFLYMATGKMVLHHHKITSKCICTFCKSYYYADFPIVRFAIPMLIKMEDSDGFNHGLH